MLDEVIVPFSFEYREQENYVFVHTSGVMSTPDLIQLASEGLAYAREHGASRFLVDHRDMTPDVGTLDIYDLPDINRQLDINDQF